MQLIPIAKPNLDNNLNSAAKFNSQPPVARPKMTGSGRSANCARPRQKRAAPGRSVNGAAASGRLLRKFANKLNWPKVSRRQLQQERRIVVYWRGARERNRELGGRRKLLPPPNGRAPNSSPKRSETRAEAKTNNDNSKPLRSDIFSSLAVRRAAASRDFASNSSWRRVAAAAAAAAASLRFAPPDQQTAALRRPVLPIRRRILQEAAGELANALRR